MPLLVEELGFDAAIDYKSENVLAGLKEHCPKGVDVYFENVGEILDAVLALINNKARISLCGMIPQYNATKPVPVCIILPIGFQDERELKALLCLIIWFVRQNVSLTLANG